MIQNQTTYFNENIYFRLTNETKLTHEITTFIPLPRNIHKNKIVIYSILFLISSIGNTTSFVALLFMNKNKNLKQSKSRIRILLLNLCIGDLIVTYLHMPLEIAWAFTDTWLAGNTLCKLMMFLRAFGFYLSSFVLITITIDRYYVIVKPLQVEKIHYLCKVLLILSWVLSFVSSIPQAFLFEVLTHPEDPTFQQCVTFRKLNSFELKIIYNLYNLMGFYGCPLLIMIFCYARIFATIAIHTRTKSGQNFTNTNINNNTNYSMKKNNIQEPITVQLSSSSRFNIDNSNNNNNNNNVPNIPLESRRLISTRSSKQINYGFRTQSLVRSNNATYHRAKYRTLRLSALIVLAFLFSWTPYYACVIWAILKPSEGKLASTIKNYIFTFSVTNTCFNPIVYGMFSNKLYEFLPCIKRNKKIQIKLIRNKQNISIGFKERSNK